MKKILALVLALCMVFALCACGQQAAAPAAAPAAEAPAAEEAAAPAEEAPAAEEPAAAATHKLGMGVVVSTDSTADANAQVDATVAAVVVDANGVIEACAIDCAQNKMDVTEGTVDTAKTFLSKMELGDDYNMVKFSGCTYEWYEQAAAFAAYCVGKTAADIEGMETVVNEEGHQVTVDEELYATCSISIGDFIGAVVKACNDEWAKEFTADSFKLGVACISDASESTDPTDDADGSVNMYTNFGAAAVAEDGTVLASVNDAIQPKIAFTKDGAVGEATFNGTKRELGENYNMVKFAGAIAEWDAQSDAFSTYITGKTAADIEGLETEINEEGHAVSTDPELLAGCTMSIAPMQAVVVKAIGNAK